MTSSICVVLCLVLSALVTVEMTAVELEGKRQRPDAEAEDLKDLLYSSMHNIVSLNDLVTDLSEKIAKLTISSAENTAEMKLSKAETVLLRAARSKEIEDLIKTDAARVSEVESLKEEIGTLNTALSLVLENKEVAIAGMTAQMEAMKEEQVELDRAHAWQSLHMAAAAACRGSTASGGTGPLGNAVLAKENTRTCNQVCRDTEFNLCDADISISGYTGQATSYSQRLGHFYNYTCGSAWNSDVKFDEVKAGGDGVFRDMSTGNWFYRFCCCRKA